MCNFIATLGTIEQCPIIFVEKLHQSSTRLLFKPQRIETVKVFEKLFIFKALDALKVTTTNNEFHYYNIQKKGSSKCLANQYLVRQCYIIVLCFMWYSPIGWPKSKFIHSSGYHSWNRHFWSYFDIGQMYFRSVHCHEQRVHQSILEPVPVPSPSWKMYWLPIHQSSLDFVFGLAIHQSTSPNYILIHNFLNKNNVKSTFFTNFLSKGLINTTW